MFNDIICINPAMTWSLVIRFLLALTSKKIYSQHRFCNYNTQIGCVSLGRSGGGSVTQDHLDQICASKELVHPLWARIYWFIWCPGMEWSSISDLYPGHPKLNAPIDTSYKTIYYLLQILLNIQFLEGGKGYLRDTW